MAKTRAQRDELSAGRRQAPSAPSMPKANLPRVTGPCSIVVEKVGYGITFHRGYPGKVTSLLLIMKAPHVFWSAETAKMGLPSAAPSRSRAGQRGLSVVLQSRRRHSSRRWSTSPGHIALLALVGGQKLLTPQQRRQCSDQIRSRPQVTREHGLNVPTVCTNARYDMCARRASRRKP